MVPIASVVSFPLPGVGESCTVRQAGGGGVEWIGTGDESFCSHLDPLSLTRPLTGQRRWGKFLHLSP